MILGFPCAAFICGDFTSPQPGVKLWLRFGRGGEGAAFEPFRLGRAGAVFGGFPVRKGVVNEVVIFSNGPPDFFYAAHNHIASTVMNMTISLTDPFRSAMAIPP